MSSPLAKYGPGVIGQAQFEQEQARKASLSDIYGPGVLGTPANVISPAVAGAAAAEKAPEKEPEKEPAYVAIVKQFAATKVADLAALVATVTDVEALTAARDADPRKGADALYAARLVELAPKADA